MRGNHKGGSIVNTINIPHSILLIVITAIVTFLIRAFPFIVFRNGRKMPDIVKKVSALLPPAIMAVLVLYCLKSDIVVIGIGSIASAIAVVVVILLHLWKRNTLLSVFAGTITYMVCCRIIPLILR